MLFHLFSRSNTSIRKSSEIADTFSKDRKTGKLPELLRELGDVYKHGADKSGR